MMQHHQHNAALLHGVYSNIESEFMRWPPYMMEAHWEKLASQASHPDALCFIEKADAELLGAGGCQPAMQGAQ